MTLMFPPSLLPLSPSGISELTATRIPATSGLGFIQHLGDPGLSSAAVAAEYRRSARIVKQPAL